MSSLKNEISQKRKQNPFFKMPIIVIMLILQRISSGFLYFFIKKSKKNKKPVIGFSNIFYTGNSRAVFEYMQDNPGYDIFWVTLNTKTLKDVRKTGENVYLRSAPDGIIGLPYFLKVDVLVVSHKGNKLPPMKHKDYKIIQLWHGIGPKAIPHTKQDYEPYDAWCAASEYEKKRHIELWDAPKDKLYVTGHPRMDRLYNYLKIPREKLLDEIGIKKDKKIVLYAPTFDVGLWPWGDSFEVFERLCEFCKEKNLILILRFHPYAKINFKKLKETIQKYDDVYLFNMKNEPDTMKMLAISDILITDWSSIYTDYFLTKRPIVYLEVDKEYYTQQRGKSLVSPDFRAGEIAHDNDEFFELLNVVLEKGNRHYKEQERLLKIIHGNVDGKASERVLQIINQFLEEN